MLSDSIIKFKQMKFGMFLHWGLYSIPGGRFNGKTTPYIGEWLQAWARMPNLEYEKYAAQFNPLSFNADEWVLKANAAGMKYIVFTAKHHDGFCMYNTKVSDYNIVSRTPWGRDPLRELADACAKYGVKLGVYYSHNLDWHEENAGGTEPGLPKNCGEMSWGNDWDFPNQEKKDFGRYFENKVMPQITELLTGYGPICEVWCDCALMIGEKYSGELYKLIHSLQPECLVNSRIGNGFGDFGSLGDNLLLTGRNHECAVESPGTLNDTWGFKYDDHHWKTPEQILDQYLSLVEKDANYLLNIGPKADGTFPHETERILEGLAEWNAKNGAAVAESSASPFPEMIDFAYSTIGGNTIHLFLRKKTDYAVLHGIQSKIIHANVPFKQDRETLEMDFSRIDPEEILPRITLEFEGRPVVDQRLCEQNGALVLSPGNGQIFHGRDEAIQKGASILTAAAEFTPAAKHMLVESDGALAQWHNPSDEIRWRIYFPEAGAYRLLVNTIRRRKEPWAGKRIVEARLGDRTITGELKADCVHEGTYANDADSILGNFSVNAGDEKDLCFRTVELLSPDACEMALTSITIQKEKPHGGTSWEEKT